MYSQHIVSHQRRARNLSSAINIEPSAGDLILIWDFILFSPFNSRNGLARRQTYQRITMADIQSTPSEITLHLRPVLSPKSNQPRTVRLLYQWENRRRQSDSQMEEIGLREFVLLALHTNAWHELRHQLYMPCAKGQIGRRTSCRVRALWMPRLLGLISTVVHNPT